MRAMSVISFTELHRNDQVWDQRATRGLVEGQVAVGRMGITFEPVLICLLGMLPYKGSVTQFLFNEWY